MSVPASAGEIDVTLCTDSIPGGVPGELRRAITDATPGDLIVLPACTIQLAGGGFEDGNATGDLDINKGLTIIGGSATIAGNLNDRVLDVQAGALVTIVGVTIALRSEMDRRRPIESETGRMHS